MFRQAIAQLRSLELRTESADETDSGVIGRNSWQTAPERAWLPKLFAGTRMGFP